MEERKKSEGGVRIPSEGAQGDGKLVFMWIILNTPGARRPA
jgi:hypothetical protein